MSLAEAILQVVETAARAQDFTRVAKVRLQVGRLAAVEPDALRFCFDAVVSGSVAQGAVLDIVFAPGRGVCRDCGASVEIETLLDDCPVCGGCRVQATEGRDMRVLDLEVS